MAYSNDDRRDTSTLVATNPPVGWELEPEAGCSSSGRLQFRMFLEKQWGHLFKSGKVKIAEASKVGFEWHFHGKISRCDEAYEAKMGKYYVLLRKLPKEKRLVKPTQQATLDGLPREIRYLSAKNLPPSFYTGHHAYDRAIKKLLELPYVHLVEVSDPNNGGWENSVNQIVIEMDPTKVDVPDWTIQITRSRPTHITQDIVSKNRVIYRLYWERL